MNGSIIVYKQNMVVKIILRFSGPFGRFIAASVFFKNAAVHTGRAGLATFYNVT